MHEAKLYEHNSFITLTYDEANLPADASLHYEDFQKFLKRLRKRFHPTKIRFYMCGEYGENMGRPHYHACLFNTHFRDKLYFKKQSDFTLYTSRTLEQLWPLGFSLIGDVTFESAAYVARYCTKIITGQPAADHYSIVNRLTGEIHQRTPEFARMSLKPGIGGDWIKKYLTDVYPRDEVIVNHKPAKPPRYYDIILERVDKNDTLSWIRYQREKRAQRHATENLRDRLAVKEFIAHARLSLKKRTL